MARRLPKFPLEMANGEKVRNIEDLRANADINSIVKYFLSGQLSLWCSAFGYDNLPEQFENITGGLIRVIYVTLGISVDEQEIETYVKENHGFSVENIAVTDDIEEEPVADQQEIKRKLAGYVDTDIRLADYSIEVTPVNDENGKIIKYIVTIENKNTEQYTRFALPYDVKGGYTKNHFEDDLYKKIANALKKQWDMVSYNGMKNSRYAGLKRGDIFEFGVYEGKSITWMVLTNKDGKLLILSEYNLCDRKFGGNIWKDADIRRWLNNDFYNSAFNAGEKEFIQCCERTNIDIFSTFEIKGVEYGVIHMTPQRDIVIDDIPCRVSSKVSDKSFDIKTKDRIFLLSGFEVEYYLNDDLKDKKYMDSSWWISSTLSSAPMNLIVYKNLFSRGIRGLESYARYDNYGVRPAFWLKY